MSCSEVCICISMALETDLKEPFKCHREERSPLHRMLSLINEYGSLVSLDSLASFVCTHTILKVPYLKNCYENPHGEKNEAIYTYMLQIVSETRILTGISGLYVPRK